MKSQISDEQLDSMLRTLMADASVDDSSINNIVDSPTLWWGVQRQINEQKEATRSPIAKYWRWLMIGVPAAAAVVFAVSFFTLSLSKTNDNVGSLAPAKEINQPSETVFVDVTPSKVISADTKPSPAKHTKREFATPSLLKAQKRNVVPVPPTVARKEKNPEIKSDFIALSYARSPESGQIVRVKVPSSMMVTLGLVATVEKPSALINAEVLVGDDGTTHSIRFIR